MKSLFVFFALLLPLLLPGESLAGGICNFDKKLIPEKLQAESKRIENLSPPLDRQRQWQEAPVMQKSLAQRMLVASWRAFGYQGKAVKKRVQLNMKQIEVDSDFRPHLKGLFPGEVAIPEADVPGGLFAFPSTESYLEWSSYPGWRGELSRFNPLGNIVAAVGAQVKTGKVFSGKGRMSLGENDTICLIKPVKK